MRFSTFSQMAWVIGLSAIAIGLAVWFWFDNDLNYVFNEYLKGPRR